MSYRDLRAPTGTASVLYWHFSVWYIYNTLTVPCIIFINCKNIRKCTIKLEIDPIILTIYKMFKLGKCVSTVQHCVLCVFVSVFVWTLEIHSVLLAFMAFSYGVAVISRGRCLYTLSGWCKLLIEHSIALLPFTLISTLRRGHVQARSRVALQSAEIPAAHFCILWASKLSRWINHCKRLEVTFIPITSSTFTPYYLFICLI